MHLTTRNVNTAFKTIVDGFATKYTIHGKTPFGSHMEPGGTEWANIMSKSSRNGPVLMIEEPVTITYTHPKERVLFNQARDANPFFHLYEALWMLAGRNDVAPLAYYAKNMLNYSDDGKTLNGAYGYRWRHAVSGCNYNLEDGEQSHDYEEVDQLAILVNHLKADPTSRRAVLQMWNVEDDLLKIGKDECPNCPSPAVAADGGFKHGQHVEYKAGVKHVVDCRVCGGTGLNPGSKDVCCNLSVMFSLRREYVPKVAVPGGPGRGFFNLLDMTVTNRSNDMIWGMLGANFVHFSFLQEYVAARLGAEVGKYHHFTNNLHVYETNWEPEAWLDKFESDHGYGETQDNITLFPLIKDPVTFEKELPIFIAHHSVLCRESLASFGGWYTYTEPFFKDVAHPMLMAFFHHKTNREYDPALKACSMIKADDWRIAATQWITKRQKQYQQRDREQEAPYSYGVDNTYV